MEDEMKEIDNVGFIGVGVMGHGLAKNIARAGYPLLFLEHPGNQPVQDLYDLGANSSASIAPIARHSDTTIGRLKAYSRRPPVRQNVIGRNAARIVKVAMKIEKPI